MALANPTSYLAETLDILEREYPRNRTVNVVCHGHSVPAGYFETPLVDTLHAYPHLLHARLARRFPTAVINVIVAAIGGEHSRSGAARFARDVLCHRPDVVTVDYGLNDRRIGLESARAAWSAMIHAGTEAGVKMILLTPTADMTQAPSYRGDDKSKLAEHADQIRRLAAEHGLGLTDSFAAFQKYSETGELPDVLSRRNHPNRHGHELVVEELLRWFPARDERRRA